MSFKPCIFIFSGFKNKLLLKFTWTQERAGQFYTRLFGASADGVERYCISKELYNIVPTINFLSASIKVLKLLSFH